jgi:hypothetical protein
MIRISRDLVPVAILCACLAYQPAHAQGLPKGEEVLDQALAATGGKAAYEKCKNRVAKGTMEIAPAGLKGEVMIYAAAPNRTYLEAEIENVGKIQDGTDGSVAWSTNPITGPHIKDGPEKAQALREADFNGDVNWRKHYKSAKTVGEDTVDGKACYKVELTTQDDQVKTHYYDQSTHLLLKSTGTAKTPMGDLPYETLVSDYKKVDDVLIPFKTRQKIANSEVIITLDKVEHNVTLPDNRFDLPEEVKKLADKEKKDKK